MDIKSKTKIKDEPEDAVECEETNDQMYGMPGLQGNYDESCYPDIDFKMEMKMEEESGLQDSQSLFGEDHEEKGDELESSSPLGIEHQELRRDNKVATKYSKIWMDFIVPEDTSGNFKAECRHCNRNISCSSTITSNLHKHMKRKHSTLYQSHVTTCVNEVMTNQPTMESFASVSDQKRIKKYASDDPRQRKFNDALLLFMSCNLVPFSVVDSPYFHGLINAANPNYRIPTSNHLVNTFLEEKCEHLKRDIKINLKNVKYICLTLDIWSSSRMRSYLGVTAYYIKNWSLKSVVLACKRFSGRHTGRRILETYEQIVKDFEIDSKVTVIITNNATNIPAFSLPGFSEIYIENETDTDPELIDLHYTSETDSEVFETLTTEHNSCFVHTLQLVVKDGFKETENLNATLHKVSKLVSFVHKSTITANILEREKKLESGFATRWNSEMKIIRSVLQISEEQLNNLGISTLRAYDRSILKDMLEIFEPFEEATNCAQRQNSVSSSLIIPCIRGLKFHLEQIQSKYNSSLVFELRSSVQKRLHSYEIGKTYQMASILDPRFKLEWCNNDEEKEAMRSCLIAAAHSVFKETVENMIEISEDKTRFSSEEPVIKRKKLFSFMTSKMGTSVKASQMKENIQAEIAKYLYSPCVHEETDVLDYWKNKQETFPNLSKLAQKYLAVPASSAPVERTFGVAGKLFLLDRCCITDLNFESVMFVKCNDRSYTY